MSSLPNSFPFLVRAVRQQDLGVLAEVLAHSFHAQDGIKGWMYPLLRMGIYEDLRNRLRSKAPYHVCLVAVGRSSAPDLAWKTKPDLAALSGTDTVLGTVEIGLRTRSPWQFQNIPYLYLSNLAVRQECRRQGVAHQLLMTCEHVALDWGHKDLYLHVLENNHPARRLYLKAGYRIQEVESSLGFWLLGRPRQIFLHKRLK